MAHEALPIPPIDAATYTGQCLASTADIEPRVHSLFHPGTGSWQYIVADTVTRRAVIIDPVLDFDLESNEISTTSANALLDLVTQNGYVVDRLLETHIHADHLTASYYLKTRLGQMQDAEPLLCIGAGVEDVQVIMGSKYCISASQTAHAFDVCLRDGDMFNFGTFTCKVMSLPGHTPDHLGYIIGGNVFVGDSLFNPDVGSARTDFPNGSAKKLWQSIQKLLSLPGDFKLYTGHDYPPADRSGRARAYATVEEHRMANKHVKDGTSMTDFVDWRTTRDQGLSPPRLMDQAMQVNICGGRVPQQGFGRQAMLYMPVTFSQDAQILQH